jgi:hypothetical protein
VSAGACACAAKASFSRLGTTGLDTTLIIFEGTAAFDSSEKQLSSRIRQGAPIAMQNRLYIEDVDVSIVDHTPEELLLLHARTVDACFERNLGPRARFSRISLSVNQMQARPAPAFATSSPQFEGKVFLIT